LGSCGCVRCIDLFGTVLRPAADQPGVNWLAGAHSRCSQHACPDLPPLCYLCILALALHKHMFFSSLHGHSTEEEWCFRFIFSRKETDKSACGPFLFWQRELHFVTFFFRLSFVCMEHGGIQPWDTLLSKQVYSPNSWSTTARHVAELTRCRV
jgi:hypothetical protein